MHDNETGTPTERNTTYCIDTASCTISLDSAVREQTVRGNASFIVSGCDRVVNLCIWTCHEFKVL